MRLPNLRRTLTTGTVAALALVAALGAAGPASAASADEVRVLGMTNQVRASVGAQPLAIDESISVIARRWAMTIAAAGRISHNPDIPLVSGGPSALAENVVVGSSIQAAHDALVASHGHYVNMVNPVVSQVGIGVVWAGGMVYIVQDFLIVRGATAPAPTSPPTSVAVTPAPAASATTRPTTDAPSTAAPSTVLPGPPAPVVPVAPAAVGPTAAGDTGPSLWLTLSLEVLRDWERASG